MTKHQRYYRANRERRLAEHKVYRTADPVAYKLRRKGWRNCRNLEKLEEWRKKNIERHRMTNRNYRKRHPEKIRLAHRMRRQSIANMQSASVIWQLVSSIRILKCGICGKQMNKSDRTIDHIIPLSKGGSDEAWNLRVVHLSCNCQKHAKMPHDFDGQHEINFADEAVRNCNTNNPRNANTVALRVSRT